MVAARLSSAVAVVVRELLRPAGGRHRGPNSGRMVTGTVGSWVAVDPLESRTLFSAALDLIGVNALRADPAFAGIDGSGVAVAVIDTGVDFTHPKLADGRVAAVDFIGEDPDVALATDEHGTHVTGIVGARDPNIGVATGVDLIGLQVFSKSPYGVLSADDTDVESAFEWVLANRARYNIVAVNMSLGFGNYTSVEGAGDDVIYADDIKRLEDAGVTVVSSAGNSFAEIQDVGSGSPGIFSTLDVGAVYETDEGKQAFFGTGDFTTGPDRLTYFSQRPNTDNAIFAPGSVITSTVPGNKTADLSGTSMASPMVAGVVALMQEAAQQFGGRRLSPVEVRTIMRQSADSIYDGDDENTSVKTTKRSYLRVNAYKAVQAIRNQFTGTGGPGSADPNGTIGGAVAGPVLPAATTTPIAASVGLDGTTDAGANDVDVYRFVVNSPGPVTVTAAGTGFQPAVRVFNATGQEVGANAGPGDATLTLTLEVGTYYAGVSGAGNATYNPNVADSGPAGQRGDYAVTFRSASGDPDGVLAGATPINARSGTGAAAQAGTIGQDGTLDVGGDDVDLYQVTAADNGSLLIDLDTLGGSAPDTHLRIFDAAGTEVAESDNDLAVDIAGNTVEVDAAPASPGGVVRTPGGAAAGHDTDSFVALPVVRGQVYYVAVSNHDNREYGPTTLNGRVSTGGTGAYSLFVSLRSRDQNGAIPQAIDVSAANLPVEGLAGEIGRDGSANAPVDVGDRDVDVFRVTPAAAGILEFDVDSTDGSFGPSEAVDTVLRMFDADGELIALNDDVGGGNGDPRLRVEVRAGDDYYVAVSGLGNDTFDPFVLGSGRSGKTGRYEVGIRLLPPVQGLALSDDSAAGGEVKTLQLNARATANVGDDFGFLRGPADVDVYRFTAPYAGLFTFRAGREGDAGADTYLRVFDANGTQLAADDNGLGGTGGSRIALDLVAGQTYLVGVNGTSAGAGAYNPLTGAGAAAGSTGRYFVEATAGKQSLTFGGRDVAVFTDADGSAVAVSLKGPGTGTVVFDNEGGADPLQIVLTGTTAATSLTIKGDTSLGGLTADGPLKAVSGKGVELGGTFAATGAVRSITLGSATGATITLGAGDALSLSAGQVSDTSLTAAGAIRSIKVDSWADAGGTDDTIAAPSVAAVTSKGDFGANVSAADVGKVKIGGALTGDVRSTGNIASVQVGSISAASVFAGVAAGFAGLPDSADDFANPAAVLKSFAVKGKSTGTFANARVAAPTIAKAAIGSVTSANGGTPFGVAGDVLRSVSGNVDGVERLRFRNLLDPSQSVARTDLAIRAI